MSDDFYERLFGRKATAVERRNHERLRTVLSAERAIYDHLPWTRSWLFLFLRLFWVGLIEGGPRDVLTPRWGAMTFAYLNDGDHPTLWHTWQSLRHPQETGIWPDGAPKSAADAARRLSA